MGRLSVVEAYRNPGCNRQESGCAGVGRGKTVLAATLRKTISDKREEQALKVSRVLVAGLSWDIGRYEELSPAGSSGFRTGIVVAAFQTDGRSAEQTDKLKRRVRKSTHLGPRCFSWMAMRPSRPVAEELLAALIASKVFAEVKAEKFSSG
jgi:hypothetical protein